MNTLDDLAYFCVKHLSSLFAERLLELFLLAFRPTIAHWTNRVIHAVVGTNFERNFSDLLQVILCASRDLAEKNFLGDTTSNCHTHSVNQLGSSEEETFRWQVLK